MFGPIEATEINESESLSRDDCDATISVEVKLPSAYEEGGEFCGFCSP